MTNRGRQNDLVLRLIELPARGLSVLTASANRGGGSLAPLACQVLPNVITSLAVCVLNRSFVERFPRSVLAEEVAV